VISQRRGPCTSPEGRACRIGVGQEVLAASLLVWDLAFTLGAYANEFTTTVK
jgi:hypothetical protein